MKAKNLLLWALILLNIILLWRIASLRRAATPPGEGR